MKFKPILQFYIFVFVIFHVTTSNSYALEENSAQRVVKVATILDHGFFYLEENGELAGYSYEYLELLSQRTDWVYDYVIIDEGSVTDSYNKAIEMMEVGEIDLIGTVLENEELEDIFSFPETHSGIVRYCLMSLANNYKITVDNYFLQDILRVALVEGAAINQHFTDLFDLRNIPYEVTYVSSYEEAKQLMINEKVDTLLATDTSYDSWMLNTLTTITRTPFYFVVKNGNTELLTELELALQSLDVLDPNFRQNLITDYFAHNHDGDIILTTEEELAISKFEYLNVGIFADYPPYETFQYGQASGITIEILDCLSDITGIQFRYVLVDSFQDIAEKMSTGEIDLVGSIGANSDVAKELGVILSEPYLDNGTLWLTRKNETTKNAVFHMVSGNIPYYENENLTRVEDIQSALLDLSENGTNSIFCEPNVAKYYLYHLDIDNVEYQTVGNISSEIVLGMGKHLDDAVMGLLNHAMLHLDSSKVEEIVLQNMTFETEITFKSFLKMYSTLIVTIVILVLSVILAATIYHSNKFKKMSRQDSMTKLFNSGYFHKYTGEKTKKLNQGCLILIDIDLFKEVNDTHGHQKGDEVIQIVAHSVKKRFRQGDMVARLGGDEFAVLLENPCDKEELESKFKSLLEDLQNNQAGIPISLSIGGHIFSGGIAYKELYDLADENLYKVKENGRNGFSFSS